MDLLDQERIDLGMTPEEACKARIYGRDFMNGGDNSPEYKRLQDFFFGGLMEVE